MKKFSISLVIILLVSTFVSYYTLPIEASAAEANIYIIKLSGVGSSYVENPSYAVEGVIMAVNASGNDYECDNVPAIHPKLGKIPPYFSVTYQIVEDWNTYKTVIESADNVIVVNTHGETLPVPSEYSKEGWTNKIAEAMLERRMIWVHMAGYPFYYVWFQGQSSGETWGSDGLQNITNNINKPDVTIPILSGSQSDGLTADAKRNLNPEVTGGWGGIEYAHQVSRDRPLLASNFSNYTVLRLWGNEVYYTGVVIAFLKSGERFDPQARSGFGAFVHIGTFHTKTIGDISTDADIYRAYVGVAAALWTRLTGFEGVVGEGYWEDPYCTFMIQVTPVIIESHWLDNQWYIRLGFFVIGALKHSDLYNVDIDIVNVDIDTTLIDGGVSISLLENESKQGNSLEEQAWAQIEWFAKAALFGLTCWNPWGVMTVLGPAIGGMILFSDFVTAFAAAGGDLSGLVIETEYTPEVVNSTHDYVYKEFQTLITTELILDNTDGNDQRREQWRIFPINYRFELEPSTGTNTSIAAGQISIAAHFDPVDDDYTVTIFHEDFEDGMDEWDRFDANSSSGLDYWGILPSNHSYYPHDCWCAGSNWRENWPNYTNGMNAQMELNVDLRPYQEVWLYYRFSAFIKEPDYFQVICYGGTNIVYQTYTDCPSGSGIINELHVIDVPGGTTTILFKFVSYSGDVDWGVFLKCIELRALIPNDADSLGDAGDVFEDALWISVGASTKNFAAYLEDEDWYKNYLPYGSTITASIENKPSNARFFLELQDAAGKVAGPGSYINYHVTSSGYYALRVFSEFGFGQYDFDISVDFPSGCPFLYVWNGSDFIIDNNLLTASVRSNGTEIEDYYRLEQGLVPLYEGYFNSYYSLQIGEFQQEHSYFDHVQLFAVDHQASVNVAVSPIGEILTYQNSYPPIVAVDEANVSWLDELSEIDGGYYEGYNGSYVLLNFGEVTSSVAKLTLVADPPPPTKDSIHIQIFDSSEGWVEVASIIPRIYWSTDIIDLSEYLPAEEELLVRLYFTDNHRIDFVGLDTTAQAEIDVEDANLLWAYHSEDGIVMTDLSSDDDVYVELLPDQQIILLFRAPNLDDEARTFIFYVKGYYCTISG